MKILQAFVLKKTENPSDNPRVMVSLKNKKIILLSSIISSLGIGILNAQSSAIEEDAIPSTAEAVEIQQTEDTLVKKSVSDTKSNDEVPELLDGIWQGSDRMVVFNSGFYDEQSGSAVPEIVLTPFYGYYADRAAESSEYTKNHQRNRNDATPSSPQKLLLKFTSLTDELFPEQYNKSVVHENGDVLAADTAASGAWDIEIKYPGIKETSHVPVAVIGNKLYLDFIIKSSEDESISPDLITNGSTFVSENLLSGYWREAGSASGITVSPPYNARELKCYYITNNNVYSIRYWVTDMDYDEEAKAFFIDSGESFSVPKHIQAGGFTYTCVAGRGKNIRNVQKGSSFEEDYVLNSVYIQKHTENSSGEAVTYTVKTATICALGKPYLTLAEGSTLEDIVNAVNSKKWPDPKPVFPPHGVLDFDWSIIKDPPETYDTRMIDLGK